MTLEQEIKSTPDGLFLWHQERSILEATELLCELMERHGVSRKELARRSGFLPNYVSQCLNGTAVMKIRALSDLFLSLGYEFHVTATPITKDTK